MKININFISKNFIYLFIYLFMYLFIYFWIGISPLGLVREWKEEEGKDRIGGGMEREGGGGKEGKGEEGGDLCRGQGF